MCPPFNATALPGDAARIHPPDHVDDVRSLREVASAGGVDELAWDPVQCFRDRARNRRKGVGVPAERDGVPNRVLEGIRLECAGDCLRNCLLTGLVEAVSRPDLIDVP